MQCLERFQEQLFFTSTFLEVTSSSMQCDLMLPYLFSTLLLSVDGDPICVFRSLFFYSGTSCSKIYVLFFVPYMFLSLPDFLLLLKRVHCFVVVALKPQKVYLAFCLST